MKNLPIQTKDGGGKPNNSRKNPNNLKRCKAPSKKRMQAIHEQRLHLLPSKKCEQCNAMRRILLYIEEMVKILHNGINSLYVDALKRRRAPSHVMEVMKAMQ